MPEAWLGSFIDELASAKPTPGGGCVSGICGMLGAGLVSMVANLTLGCDGYSAVDKKMEKLLESAGRMGAVFSKLAKDDMVVYEEYLAAFRMPKSSAEERKIRNAALAVRSKLIVSVPFEVVKQSVSLAAIALDVLENGNAHAAMDAGAAVRLSLAAAEIAADNVRFNLSKLHGEVFRETILARLDTMIADIEAISAAADKILSDFREPVGD